MNVDQSTDSAAYEKGNDRIYLSSLVPLDEYIKKNAKRFTPEELNLLKLQYLDFFKYVSKNQIEKLVEFDYRKLIYDTVANKVIFPTKSDCAATDVTKEYERFMAFLKEQCPSVAKPGKIPYSDIENRQLQIAFQKYVKNSLTKHPCVNKVYLFNAESKKRSGRYQMPFVHFDWAQLGSDFDLLIDIDERYEIPKEWAYKFFWKVCSSDYYLLGDIDFPIASPYIERFPNIDFHQHLIEAYVFFGSKGNQAVKNEYLKKNSASLLYQKGGGKPIEETDKLLRDFLVKHYSIEPLDIEKLDVPSFNEIFRIRTERKEFAAKIMQREDFTPAVKGHSGRHLEYEAQLLEAISKKEAPVIIPLYGDDGKLLQCFDNRYCMLFPFIKSDKEGFSSLQRLNAASKTLALVHEAVSTIDVANDHYRFNEALEYWIDQYISLYEKIGGNDERVAQFKSKIPAIKEAGQRILCADGLPWIHSHGDICPRNFFYAGGEAVLFDFQVIHYGPRIEDIAEGALEFALSGTVLDETLINQFIATYEMQNPLTVTERDLLPTMLFLQAAFKLARAFRIQVLFGYKVDHKRVEAFQDYQYAH